MSALLYEKFIIYKLHNKPNQSIFLTVSPSTNTLSGPTACKETLAILPTNSRTSPSLLKYDPNNIHNDIKVMTEKHHYDMKTLNDHISAML